MKASLDAKALSTLLFQGSLAESVAGKMKQEVSGLARLTVDEKTVCVETVTAPIATRATSLLDEVRGTCEEPGAWCVDYKKIALLLNTLPPNSTVTITEQPGRETSDDGFLVFTSGKVKWRVPCQDSILVSHVSHDIEGDEFIFNGDSLAVAFNQTSFCADLYCARDINNNICISVNPFKDGKIWVSGTNGVLCAYCVLPEEVNEATCATRLLLPILPLSGILRILGGGECVMTMNEKMLRIVRGNISIRIALPSDVSPESFPPFEKLIVAAGMKTVSLMRSRLAQAVEACKAINLEESLFMFGEGALQIAVYNSANGLRYNTTIPHPGDSVTATLGVAPVFLQEYMKKINEEVVTISFPDMDAPPFFKVEDGSGSYFFMKTLVDLLHVPPTELEDASEGK